MLDNAYSQGHDLTSDIAEIVEKLENTVSEEVPAGKSYFGICKKTFQDNILKLQFLIGCQNHKLMIAL